jgi:hypothetical protein
VHGGLAALVAVRERRVECALAAIGHGDDGDLGVGSRFPDTGGETPGRFSRAEGTLELVRCDALRIAEPCGIHPHSPLDDLIYQSYISPELVIC